MVIHHSVAPGAVEGKTQDVGEAPLADHEYCRTLASDFSIPSRAVLDALLGEPMKKAYKIAKWAGSLPREERVKALKNWAKKNRAGIYAPKPEPEPPKTQPKPKKKESYFSPGWADDIPPAEVLDRMDVVA